MPKTSSGLKAVNCFHKKNSIISTSEGSNYASIAAFVSCIVNKITCEDTEAGVHKYFFQKSFENFTRKHWKHLFFTRKIPVLGSLFKKVACPRVFSCRICETFKSIFFYRRPLVAAF